MNQELFKRILSSVILIPVVIFFIVKGGIFFNFFITICFFITVFEWFKMTKKIIYYIHGLIFLIISFYSIYHLRNQFENDFTYLLLVTTICVATDIGGYVFGNIIKGPTITKISPNKTYSGMIGGFFLSIILTNFFLDLPYLNNSIEFSSGLLIFIILISSVSQLGDISISYFKRRSKIKDTGKIIPGHGGLLDRIDGMIFAFPCSYLIISKNIIKIF